MASAIDEALKAAEGTKKTGDKAFSAADNVQKISDRMGRGQPKKKEEEKANNKVVLYFNDAEIKDITEVAAINGFSEKDKNKYVKSIVKKMIRAELKQFG